MLQLLRLSLPYPVIQLWNELEDGQMVKFPAYDEKFGEVILHAQRDGNERMEVEIDRLGLRGVEDAYSAEITIFSVRQNLEESTKSSATTLDKDGSTLDATIDIESSKNGHANSEGVDSLSNHSSPQILGTITPIRASTPEGSKSKKRKLAKPMRIKPEDEDNFEYEIIEKKSRRSSESSNIDSESVINITPVTVKTETISCKEPTTLTPAEKKDQHKSGVSPTVKTETEQISFNTRESRGNSKITKSYSPQNFERINKKGRGPPQFMCYLCEMRFVYLRSFQKHMDRHGVSAKEVLQAINKQRRQLGTSGLVGMGGSSEASTTVTSSATANTSTQDLDAAMYNPNNTLYAQVVGTNETGVPVYEIRPNASYLENDYNGSPSPSLVPSASTSTAVSPDVSAMLSTNQSPTVDVEVPVNEMEGTCHITPEGPYSCSMCERVFQYRTPFIRHLNVTHKQKVIIKVEDSRERNPKRGKVLYCPVCAAKFCYQGPFAKHMHERHGMAGMEIQNLVQSLMRGDDPQVALQMASLPTDVQFSVAASAAQGFQTDSFLDGSFQMNADLSRDRLTGELDQSIAPEHEAKAFMMGKVFTLSKAGNDFLLTDSTTGQDISLGTGFCCHLCKRTFTYRSSFIKHLRADHNMNVMDGCDTRPNRRTGKTFPCHLCSKTFMYRIPYQKHMETAHKMPVRIGEHGGKKKSDFFCSVCHKHFTYKLSYRKHLKNDHGIDPDVMTAGNAAVMYDCNECQAKFTYSEALEIHKARRHRGSSGASLPPRIKSVMEDIASWQEMNKSSQGTILIEEDMEGDVDYSTYLTEQSSSSNYLDSDLQNNSLCDDAGPSMIKCKLCDKAFRYNMAFRKHMKKMHPDNGETLDNQEIGTISPGRSRERQNSGGLGGKIHGLLYGCSLCPYRSSFVSMVQVHVEKRHLVESKEAAVVLLQRNSINAKLAATASRKPHLCYECAQGYARKSLLLLHRLRRHRNKFRRNFRR